MGGWRGVALLAAAMIVGAGLRLFGIKPDGSPGWLWTVSIGFALMAAYSLNKAQEAWPRDAAEAPPWGAVESTIVAGASMAAALVMFGLAAIGGIGP